MCFTGSQCSPYFFTTIFYIMFKYDVYISRASEDKDLVARLVVF